MRATWLGCDLVGTLVCDTPNVPCSSTLDRRNGASGRGVRASSDLGYGSGWDWKALSARRPSPTEFLVSKRPRSRGTRESCLDYLPTNKTNRSAGALAAGEDLSSWNHRMPVTPGLTM